MSPSPDIHVSKASYDEAIWVDTKGGRLFQIDGAHTIGVVPHTAARSPECDTCKLAACVRALVFQRRADVRHVIGHHRLRPDNNGLIPILVETAVALSFSTKIIVTRLGHRVVREQL